LEIAPVLQGRFSFSLLRKVCDLDASQGLLPQTLHLKPWTLHLKPLTFPLQDRSIHHRALFLLKPILPHIFYTFGASIKNMKWLQ
jgi:hypothetical protein